MLILTYLPLSYNHLVTTILYDKDILRIEVKSTISSNNIILKALTIDNTYLLNVSYDSRYQKLKHDNKKLFMIKVKKKIMYITSAINKVIGN